MLNARPDILTRHMRNAQRALGAAGLRLNLPGPGPVWPWRLGCDVLILWKGERLPYPSLDFEPGHRPAVIAGYAAAGQAQLDTYSDLTWADGVYHFAVIAFGPGGVERPLDPIDVQTRVRSGGAWFGLMPNPPARIAARLLAGNLPLVTWVHSRAAEQITPATFQVYETTPPTPFNFASPVATVGWEQDRTRYSWVGTALGAGQIRCYTVRAISSTLVKSLIPRKDRPPSGDYNAVELVRCPRVEVGVAATADPGRVEVEVLDVV